MKQLDGKVGIVTGASRGIGAAIAKLLAQEGARLVLNYFQSEELVGNVRDEILDAGGEAFSLRGDVSKPEEASRLVEAALAAYGKIDFLVNNAGITRDITLRKMEAEQWDEVIAVNLNSVYNCSKAVVPHLITQKNGAIVNISSIIGEAGGFGQTNYAAAKAGVIGFTKSAALELARYSIAVNAVCPGFIETDMLAVVPLDIQEQILDKIPLGRFGSTKEVAKAVRYLLSDGQYVTGQCLNINGGLYM